MMLLFAGKISAQQKNKVLENSSALPTVWQLKLIDYLNLMDRPKPVITGGCVSLTEAALSANLLLMALQVSGGHATGSSKITIDSLIALAAEKRDSLSMLADTDNNIFQQFIEVGHLPHQSPAQQRFKDSSMHALLLKATNSPINSAKQVLSVFELFRPAEKVTAQVVFSDVKSAENLLNGCFQALVILAKDDIGQLPSRERAAFQMEVDHMTAKEKTIFAALNP